MKTTAELYATFLQSRGTVRNWQTLVMYNYGGKFIGGAFAPDWATYNYRFDDGSCIKIRCSYKAEQRIVEVLIGSTIVTTICSYNYMKF